MLKNTLRRDFVGRLMSWSGLAAASSGAALAMQSGSTARSGSGSSGALASGGLGSLYLPRTGRSHRSSSWDRTGRNNDFVIVQPGATAVLADITGAGCI